MKQAMYWHAAEGGLVRCDLCPQACDIGEGKKGLCGARTNHGGQLFAGSFGEVTSIALDPIEKKPLRRFQPGCSILSVGSYGCNLRCAFCQNHEISSREAPHRAMRPEEVAAASRELYGSGNIGVAYTYNEPLVGFEFVLECARLVRSDGGKNVLVTNGYVNLAPFGELLRVIDAVNIDLKGFTEAFYSSVGGRLEPVKAAIELAAERCHVEVTVLIVPGLNDSGEEMEALSAWLAGIRRDIPLHVSRFFPSHRMADVQPTSVETIMKLREVAQRHLRHVYMGNC